MPVGQIDGIKEAAEHPQTKARKLYIEAGGVRMPGNPVKLSGYDDPAVRVGAPDLNQHGAAIRREFASSNQFADGRREASLKASMTSQQDRLTRGNTE